MKRVLAVMLIATLTTMMLGIERPSWAAQGGDQTKAEKQRAAVVKALGGMRRGSTIAVELHVGEKFDAVIEEITPDTLTVLRQQGDTVVHQTIDVGDIAKVKKTTIRKMGVASKVLLWTAATIGVLFVAGLAACASAAGAPAAPAADSAPTR